LGLAGAVGGGSFGTTTSGSGWVPGGVVTVMPCWAKAKAGHSPAVRMAAKSRRRGGLERRGKRMRVSIFSKVGRGPLAALDHGRGRGAQARARVAQVSVPSASA
jgi:hypothetical protein